MFHIDSTYHLSLQDLKALEALSTLCRQDIIRMVAQAQSGHPGGSCSIIDVLAVLYATMTHFPGAPNYGKRDRVVFSAGHLSPAAYSILAEMGYFPIEDAIAGFRRVKTPFEGHVSHSVPGVEFTNGSLGKGLSQAAGIAHAAKLCKKDKEFHVFVIMGDGEQEEGQVAEARRSVTKFGLNNLTVIIDRNGQQLDNAVHVTAPTLDIKKEYLAAGFSIYEIDGHDYRAINHAILAARAAKQPTLIIADTLMGKGVSFMEAAARKHSSEWHGKAPSPDETVKALEELKLSDAQHNLLKQYGHACGHEYGDARSSQSLDPQETLLRNRRDTIPAVMLETGPARTYAAGTQMDNRTAFGNALVDIARLNPGKVIAMTCDLSGSVKMKQFAKEYPSYFLDEGIAEQHMLSKAGALSLNGLSVFASSFGVFLSALAADQMRINDINNTRVKMIATHCGLNVGEDGMTHQCITDLGFVRGLFNTIIVEPADPNQMDHAIRMLANEHRPVYVRMGRAHNAIITKGATKKDGTPFYDGNYRFRLGAADTLRCGEKCTIIASGALVAHAVAAADSFNAQYYNGKESIRVLALTSLKPVDEQSIVAAARETGKIITLEDHNPETGLGSIVAGVLAHAGLEMKLKVKLIPMGPRAYAGSGEAAALYAEAGISTEKVVEKIKLLLNK